MSGFLQSKEGLNEGPLTLIALIAGGISPLLIVSATGFGTPMLLLFWAVGVPAQIILFGILIYAKASGLNRLYWRLWVGIVGGILLTMALDVVRMAGVHTGILFDTSSVFGRLIAGVGMKTKVTPPIYLEGNLYHFFNGIAFGVVYMILFGRSRWWWAVLYSVFFVELGMMILPPMAKMFGPFGVGKFGTVWNSLFVTTLLAHMAMGLALGLVVQTWGQYRGLWFKSGRAPA